MYWQLPHFALKMMWTIIISIWDRNSVFCFHKQWSLSHLRYSGQGFSKLRLPLSVHGGDEEASIPLHLAKSKQRQGIWVKLIILFHQPELSRFRLDLRSGGSQKSSRPDGYDEACLTKYYRKMQEFRAIQRATKLLAAFQKLSGQNRKYVMLFKMWNNNNNSNWIKT